MNIIYRLKQVSDYLYSSLGERHDLYRLLEKQEEVIRQKCEIIRLLEIKADMLEERIEILEEQL